MGMVVGLDDLNGLFQPSLYDSTVVDEISLWRLLQSRDGTEQRGSAEVPLTKPVQQDEGSTQKRRRDPALQGGIAGDQKRPRKPKYYVAGQHSV